MGSRPERGAYGNARGVPDKQKRRRRMRENDPRYIQAMADVRANNEMIDRLANQPGVEAALSNEARAKVGLVYEKPSVAVDVDTARPETPRVTQGAVRMFVDCHCGHTQILHTQARSAPACSQCDCPGYRPSTAPDPLSETAPALTGIERLLQSAKESSSRRTVLMAERIEVLLLDLKARVTEEDDEREARAAELRRTKEARERLEKAEAELREAREALASVSRKKPAKKAPTVMKPPPGMKQKGKFPCPSCEHEPFTSPQGLGAHRYQKHGHRRGDS